MYCAQKEHGDSDFTSLAIRDNKIEFKYNTGTGTATLISDEIVPGEWIKVRIISLSIVYTFNKYIFL